MSTSVAQHPFLWLLLAFLLGIFLEWLLGLLFFRKPLADARTAARRRGEELDSERFAHSRTQAELKAKLADLDIAQKSRIHTEMLLRAVQSESSTLDARLAEAHERHTALSGQLDMALRRGDLAERDLSALTSELEGVRLQVAERDAALATEISAVDEMRGQLARQGMEAEAAIARVFELEEAAASRAAQARALATDLDAAKREGATAESSLTELRRAIEGAQAELAELRTVRGRLEAENVSLKTKLQAMERSATDAKSSSTAIEQKLKARIEEVKQLTSQLGEASEELASVKTRAAQLEANWTAAQATRKSLEKEVAQLTAAARVAPSPPAENTAVLTELKRDVEEAQQEAASWRSKAEELEAELLATSRAHQTLEVEVERLRSNAPGAAPDDALTSELETMTRERNELAAELAALKSARKR